MNTPTKKGPVIGATVAAVVLMVAGGTVYRLLARHLARPTEHVTMPPGALSVLPMRLGNWTGREVPMDQAVVEATDTDDHINRVYSRAAGTESVALFVAYGVRARDLMPHHPEVCYPGSGWTLDDTRTTDLALADGSELECRVYTFSRPGLTNERIAVLNYYIVDGQYSPDVSLLRSRVWRGSGGVKYTAQVQITCSGSAFRGLGSAVKSIRSFAADAADAIRALMPDDPSGSRSTDTQPSSSPEVGAIARDQH